MGTKAIFCLLFIILLFFSPFFIKYNPQSKIFSFSLPHVLSGDEPHYMALTSSIIRDLDFDVGNNYANAVNGEGDLGFYMRRSINHHTEFVDKKTGERVYWDEVFSLKDFSRLKDKENLDIGNFKESSERYPGLPFFSSIFIWPFRNSVNLDSAAILLTAIISLIGFYFLYLTLMHYKNNRQMALMIVLIFMFATQDWYYARTFYPGPYISSFLMISYYLIVAKEKTLLPGILFGLSFLMNRVSMLLFLIFALYLLKDRKFSKLILFSIPLVIAITLHLIYNYIIWLDPFYFPITYIHGSIIPGFLGLFFSLKSGLLIFSPFLIFAFLGFYHFYKQKKNEAVLVFLLFFVYILIIASSIYWDAGASYGTRHASMVMNLLAIPLLFWADKSKNKPLEILFLILVITSFIISLYGTFMELPFVLQREPLYYYLKSFYEVSP